MSTVDQAPIAFVQSIAQPKDHAVAISSYISASLAANSKRAYLSDLTDFQRWGGCVPCNPEMVAAYIATRAPVACMATLARRLVGIGKAHTSQGLPDPTKNELVRRLFRGVKRIHGKPARKVAPLLREHLIGSLAIRNGAKPIRDRALLLVGFAGALRRSEIVGLDVADIQFVQEGMLLHIRRSKTDQAGEGQTVAIPFGRTCACPLKALREWLGIANIESGPVFRSVRKDGRISDTRLAAQSVALIVKAYASRIGLDEKIYSGHSLRAGLVTSAAQVGVSLPKIQQQSRHASLAMLAEYIRDANVFENNAAGLLL